MDYTYQDLITMAITLIAGLFGAPIIQLVKNGLSVLFKKPIQDRTALAVAAVTAGLLAGLQLYLMGLLTPADFTVQAFPATAFTIFGVATIYYGLFSKVPNFFGEKFLLRRPEKALPPY